MRSLVSSSLLVSLSSWVPQARLHPLASSLNCRGIRAKNVHQLRSRLHNLCTPPFIWLTPSAIFKNSSDSSRFASCDAKKILAKKSEKKTFPPRQYRFTLLNSATSLCELIKFKYLNWKNIFMPIEFSFPWKHTPDELGRTMTAEKSKNQQWETFFSVY